MGELGHAHFWICPWPWTQHGTTQYWTYSKSILYSACFCLNHNENQIIWENKQNSIWLYGPNPVYLPFATCFPALGVAEFDRRLISCETACQDEWQVCVALWDDHVRGKYTKKGKLGSGSTRKFIQQSEFSALINLCRDQGKTQIWNANWIQCSTLQILSKLSCFFALRTSALWAMRFLKSTQKPRFLGPVREMHLRPCSHSFVTSKAVKCLLTHILCMTL